MNMPYNICFFNKSIPFTDKSIQLQTSMGGSETMLICMANELANQGHTVHVFTELQDEEKHEGDYNGVKWRSEDKLLNHYKGVNWDILISVRAPGIFSHNINSSMNILWNHDVLTYPKQYISFLWSVHRLFFVSNWHKEQYCEQMPEIEPMSYATRNGIDLSLIPKDVQKQDNTLIYTSRPERGLRWLLEIFEQMREQRPELRLFLSRYYSAFEPRPEVKAMLAEYDDLVLRYDGVRFLGNLNKEQLYKVMSQAKLAVYPSDFRESSCITALEAQACGTPMVTSNLAALKETLHDDAGIKLEGHPKDKEYQEQFINVCFSLLDDNDKYTACQEAGRQHVQNYTFDNIAKEWVLEFDNFFTQRYNKYSKSIFGNLLWYEDRLSAKYLGDKCGCELPEVPEMNVEEYYRRAPATEAFYGDRRLLTALTLCDIDKAVHILDFACNTGYMSKMLKDKYSEANVLGIDISSEAIDHANELFADIEGLEFAVGDTDYQFDRKFDIIFAGEILEHFDENYEQVINTLDKLLASNGIIIYTVPSGPWREYRLHNADAEETHNIHWQYTDILSVFGHKQNFKIIYNDVGLTPRGNQCGHWIFRYQKDKNTNLGTIDLEHKIKTFKPYVNISACMIMKDGENYIRQCLKSIRDVVDEIIIADTGSQDRSIEIAKEYTDKIYSIGKCPDTEGYPDPGDFAWARNQSLEHASGEYVCFVPSTPIRTDSGFKNIEDICIGDKVLTHAGRYMSVDQVHEKDYNGDIVYIKPVYSPESVGMTPNHPVLAIKNYECYIEGKLCKPDCARQWKVDIEKGAIYNNCRQGYLNYNLEWVPADQLEVRDIVVYQSALPEHICSGDVIDISDWVSGEYCVLDDSLHYNIRKNGRGKAIPRYIHPGSDFWRLCGLYLAEGFTASTGQIYFAFHRNEVEYHQFVLHTMNKYFGLAGKVVFPDDKTNQAAVYFSSKIVADFWNSFVGIGADNKKLPQKMLDIPVLDAFNIFAGELDGDGTYLHPDSFKIVSNSRELIYQMRDILTRLCVVSSIYKHDPKRNSAYILSVGGAGLYSLSSVGLHHPYIDKCSNSRYNNLNQDGWCDGKRIYTAIRSIDKQHYVGKVYNLGVKDDNSYTAGGIVVHNCWIDTDEQLIHPEKVRQYLDLDSIYNGLVLRQYHVKMDENDSFDIPARIFRRGKYKFYGAVHEQPAEVDNINQAVDPTYMPEGPGEPQILHLGYLTNSLINSKGLVRNAKLLELDKIKYPDRRLSRLIYMRDRLNIAKYNMGLNDNLMTIDSKEPLEFIVSEWNEYFSKQDDGMFFLAYDYYRQALSMLRQGRPYNLDLGTGEQTYIFKDVEDMNNYMVKWNKRHWDEVVVL